MRKSPILLALEKIQAAQRSRLPQSKSQNSNIESGILRKLIEALESISQMSALVGPKGDRGDVGPKPFKGIDYFTKEEIIEFLQFSTPVKGVDYFDGKPGSDGKDASLDDINNVALDVMKEHEVHYDHSLIHDPKILGTKEVDENTLKTNGVLTYDGKKLVYRVPEKIKDRPKYFGGTSPTNSRWTVVSKTAAYTPVYNEDGVILCDASGGAFTVTLPDAADNDGRQFIIKKTDSSDNFVTIATTSSQTIDGSTTQALAVQYQMLRLVAFSDAWHLI